MSEKNYSIRDAYSSSTATYCTGKNSVRIVSSVNKDYFVELHDSKAGSGYKVEWNNAQGFGVHYIPEAVFYDLPALMHILNHAKEFLVFEPINIYAEQPIATLFA